MALQCQAPPEDASVHTGVHVCSHWDLQPHIVTYYTIILFQKKTNKSQPIRETHLAPIQEVEVPVIVACQANWITLMYTSVSQK